MLVCVGNARSVCITLGLPPVTACVLSQSTLLRLQVALQGNCLKRALGFMHFLDLSHYGSGSQVLHKGTDCILCPSQVQAVQAIRGLVNTLYPGGAVCLITSLVLVAQFPRCASGEPSQVCHVSPLGSWCLAVTFLEGVNCSGSQEELVSNWEPARSLVEHVVSEAEFAPCPLALSVARLPSCLRPSCLPLGMAQFPAA